MVALRGIKGFADVIKNVDKEGVILHYVDGPYNDRILIRSAEGLGWKSDEEESRDVAEEGWGWLSPKVPRKRSASADFWSQL